MLEDGRGARIVVVVTIAVVFCFFFQVFLSRLVLRRTSSLRVVARSVL